jgi:mono/diheme cytochrome c family protein
VTEEALLAGIVGYRNNCAGCHEEFGRPSRWGTSGFYPRVPQFADDPPDLPASQLFSVVKHGIRYSGMGAWDGLLPDEDIWRIVTLLSRLKNLPPRADAAWKNPPKG